MTTLIVDHNSVRKFWEYLAREVSAILPEWKVTVEDRKNQGKKGSIQNHHLIVECFELQYVLRAACYYDRDDTNNFVYHTTSSLYLKQGAFWNHVNRRTSLRTVIEDLETGVIYPERASELLAALSCLCGYNACDIQGGEPVMIPIFTPSLENNRQLFKSFPEYKPALPGWDKKLLAAQLDMSICDQDDESWTWKHRDCESLVLYIHQNGFAYIKQWYVGWDVVDPEQTLKDARIMRDKLQLYRRLYPEFTRVVDLRTQKEAPEETS